MTGERHTRRGAIGRTTATLAGLAALLAAPGAAQAASAPLPMARVVNYDDLAAEVKRLHAESRESLHLACEAQDAFEATLTEEQRKMLDKVLVLDGNAHYDEQVVHMTDLARHLPGLAPTLLMLWHHVIEESYQSGFTCCSQETGFTP